MPDPSQCPAGAEEYFQHFADGHLMIGRPGVDGLEFAYRADAPGIWVWYPLDGEWRQVAADFHALDRDWRSGELTV